MTTLFLDWLVDICNKITDYACLGIFAIIFLIYAIIMTIGFFIGIDLGPKKRIDD